MQDLTWSVVLVHSSVLWGWGGGAGVGGTAGTKEWNSISSSGKEKNLTL